MNQPLDPHDATQPPALTGPRNEPWTVSAFLLNFFTVIAWGGTPVAISFAVQVFPPVMAAGIRFFLAILVMWIWNRWEGVSLSLRDRQWRMCAAMGVLLFLQIGIFTVGVKLSNSSHGSLFINTYIFWVVAIEHFITHADRLTPRKCLGLMLAASGVLLVLSGSSPATAAAANSVVKTSSTMLVGDALVLISAFVLGTKIVVTKHAVRTVEPGKLIFWHNVFGVLLFALTTLLFEPLPTGLTWDNEKFRHAALGLLYDGVIVAGVCFGLNARLLKKYSASTISVYSFLTPLFGIVFAVLFRGDPLSSRLAFGGALVGTGILIVNLRRSRS